MVVFISFILNVHDRTLLPVQLTIPLRFNIPAISDLDSRHRSVRKIKGRMEVGDIVHSITFTLTPGASNYSMTGKTINLRVWGPC